MPEIKHLTTEQIEAHRKFAWMELTAEQLQQTCRDIIEFDFGPTERRFHGHFQTPVPGVLISKSHLQNAISRKRMGIANQHDIAVWATLILVDDVFEIDPDDEDFIAEELNNLSWSMLNHS